jgi:hypothetical protein
VFFGIHDGLTKGVLSRVQIPSPVRASLDRALESRGFCELASGVSTIFTVFLGAVESAESGP